MAKKQKAESGRKSNLTPSPFPEGKQDIATYVIGTWAGLPQWRCLLCAFDTLDEQEMIEHAEAHGLGTAIFPPEPPPLDPAPDKEGEEADVFEVELKEIGSTVDKQGNEHKTFTVKE